MMSPVLMRQQTDRHRATGIGHGYAPGTAAMRLPGRDERSGGTACALPVPADFSLARAGEHP